MGSKFSELILPFASMEKSIFKCALADKGTDMVGTRLVAWCMEEKPEGQNFTSMSSPKSIGAKAGSHSPGGRLPGPGRPQRRRSARRTSEAWASRGYFPGPVPS